MIRIGLAVFSLGAVALVGCAKRLDEAPAYSLAECKRIALIDAATGEAIVGAEDMAFDAASRRIIISAYDRRTAEREAARGAAQIAQGGVYAAPLDRLQSRAQSITLSSVIARDTIDGGLRPHGLSFDPDRREIMFVNRSYKREGRRWRMAARIERAGADGEVFVGAATSPRCSANDVANIGGDLFVSYDHAACGWRGGLEDLFALRASGVEVIGGGAIFDKARHANGIAAVSPEILALAATRDHEIILIGRRGAEFERIGRIKVPGAPDNLTVNANGDVVAALHPSLFAIGAERRLGIGRSAGRVVSVNPATGAVTLLFDDPKASLLSAVSVGLEIEDMLVIGSALDRGIVLCRKDRDPA